MTRIDNLQRELRLPAAAMLLLALAGPALAHAHLISATPAVNSMAMPAPTELRLKFSEGLELKLSSVTITGGDKTIVKTGPVRLDPKDDTLLIVPLLAPLPDGHYTVDWKAVATDGHKTEGHYTLDAMQSM
jgi:methionine-rich copper-binding protein CopC